MKLLIVLLFFSLIPHLHANDVEQLAKDPQWLNFLHYHRGLWRTESSIDDAHFFLSNDGVTDPEAELQATLEALKNKPETACRFPARAKWLKEILGIKVDFSTCQDYLKFFQDKFPKNVYLVFSSYYLESPASAFGHTLLRFSKQQANHDFKHNELMDDGINYGATVTNTNPILYTILGATGGFKGSFASVPYFYKIREYNDFESRDLWSYQIKMTEEEKERLVDHLWEVGHSYFDYYFFTENCSQKMLALLDAANPSWKLLERNPYFVVPGDTLKTIAKTPGLLGEITYRPSAKKIFLEAYRQLRAEELEIFDRTLNQQTLDTKNFTALNEMQAANVLDTLIYYLDYKYADEILREDDHPINQFKRNILAKRSDYRSKGITPKIEPEKLESPHLAHGSRRIATSYQATRHADDLALLSYRFSMHDINDPIIGSPKSSSIEFFNFTLSYNLEKNHLKLYSLRPVQVMTINPWTPYHYPMSFKAGFEITRQPTAICQNCLVPTANLAAGPSFSLGKQTIISWWLDSNLSYHHQFEKQNVAAYLGASISVFWRFQDYLSSETTLGAGQYILQQTYDWKAQQTLRWHVVNDLSLGLEATAARRFRAAQASLYYYY